MENKKSIKLSEMTNEQLIRYAETINGFGTISLLGQMIIRLKECIKEHDSENRARRYDK
jgi:hypothetical protein